ncbi:MAG TPA: hypothetical protein EYP73_07025, partial [Acidimicrobiia bacterium]|nr:hypothetical protein [Acidimicrobiia bacterium]
MRQATLMGLGPSTNCGNPNRARPLPLSAEPLMLGDRAQIHIQAHQDRLPAAPGQRRGCQVPPRVQRRTGDRGNRPGGHLRGRGPGLRRQPLLRRQDPQPLRRGEPRPAAGDACPHRDQARPDGGDGRAEPGGPRRLEGGATGQGLRRRVLRRHQDHRRRRRPHGHPHRVRLHGGHQRGGQVTGGARLLMAVRIEATRLVPGRGDVVENGVVVLDGDVIVYAGAADEAPETPDAEVITTETVMPGMWECHGHFIGTYTANIDEVHTLRPQLGAMRVTADARRALDAGFTSVREVGGFGVFLARAIEEGQVVGPNIYGSGLMLSMTAGHGDTHGMDLDKARASWVRVFGEDGIVDGPDQCRAGVRRMLRLGAKVIKVHASGGVMSELDDPHLPQFSLDELRTIVDEATRMERLVAAHCHGKRGIMNALEAGIKTIEHGTYLDEEAADAMVETGAILVPTRWIVEFLVAEGEKRGIPEYAKKKIQVTAEHHA